MTRQRAYAIILGGAGTLASVGLAGALVSHTWSRWPGPDPVAVAEGVELVATVVAAALSAWVAFVLMAATLSLLRQRAAPREYATDGPHLIGRVATGLLAAAALGLGPSTASACATTLVSASPSPSVLALSRAATPSATAMLLDLSTEAPGKDPRTTAASSPELDLPAPGWTPTPPAPTPRPTGEVWLVSSPPDSAAVPDVVVRRGDTLWGIAARHLGADATDQDVAEEWPRWFAANRDVIGSDPDLIFPGQRLVTPGARR